MKKFIIPTAIVVILAIFAFISCRKEAIQEHAPSNIYSSASVSPNYTENDITNFITVVTTPSNRSSSSFISTSEAYTKLQATLNYVFNDVDTAMVSQQTYSSTIYMPSNSSGVSMHDMINASVSANTYIASLLAASAGSGFNNRVTGVSIDPNGTNYTISVTIGKAYITPPSYAPTLITDGSHPWYKDGDGDADYGNGVPNCSGSITGVANILRTEGNAWMSQVTATRINQGCPSGYTAYLENTVINTLYVPGTTRPNIEWYDDSLLKGTMPTTALYIDPSSHYYFAKGSPQFAADKMISGINTSARYASYVRLLLTASDQTDSSANFEKWYNYCMSPEYINYYVSKVQDIFDAFKPDSDCFPMVKASDTTQCFYVKDNLWDKDPTTQYSNGGLGQTRGWKIDTIHPPYNYTRTLINHTYYYKYCRRKFRKIQNFQYYAIAWSTNRAILE